MSAYLRAEVTSYVPKSDNDMPKQCRVGCLSALLRPTPRQGVDRRTNAVAMAPQTPVQPASGARRALPPLSRNSSTASDC